MPSFVAQRGPGTRDGPAWFGHPPCGRLPADKKKRDHPASPRSLSASLEQGAIHSPDMGRRRRLEPGAFSPGPLHTPGLGCVRAAYPGTYPLDRTAPAKLNIATALHAEAISHYRMRGGGWGFVYPAVLQRMGRNALQHGVSCDGYPTICAVDSVECPASPVSFRKRRRRYPEPRGFERRRLPPLGSGSAALRAFARNDTGGDLATSQVSFSGLTRESLLLASWDWQAVPLTIQPGSSGQARG